MKVKNNKTEKNDECCDNHDQIQKIIKNGIDEIGKMVKEAKGRFDKVDIKTKKRIAAGVIGAVALLAGVIGAKTSKKKRNK